MANLDDATRYRLMRLLEEKPGMSQRELADAIGISLGKVNYCLQALVDKGWIKIRNFKNTKNKRAYLYKLTPAGMAEKMRVTRQFLDLKLSEHEQILVEIEQLKQEVRR